MKYWARARMKCHYSVDKLEPWPDENLVEGIATSQTAAEGGLDRGGTALLLHPSVTVAQEIGGQGRIAWARVKWGDVEVGFASIYAPNKRRSRMVFWEHLKKLMRDGDWCLLGDFNQVDMPEDAFGRSPLIRGREERWWHQFLLEKGWVDSFISATHMVGGRFTRMAKKNDRFVGARLDRVYLSSDAHWIHHVREVSHHNSSRLSNHVPLTVVFQVEDEASSQKMETYSKMRVVEVEDPAVKDVRREKNQLRRDEGNLAAEIAWRQERVSVDSSLEELQAMANVKERLWRRELEEAREWKTRSRDKWISADAIPSRYFFTKLKAKWARESIEALEDNSGDIMTEREAILSEIHEFYQVLYTAEEGSEERSQAQEEVVGLINRSLSDADSQRMSAVPDSQEIELVVFRMARSKAPGIDGLTAEMVRDCWDFVGEDCVRLVHTVWAKKKILPADWEDQANFDELLRILAKYEMASGAKINLCKSLIMPLGSVEVPAWARHVGCEIATGTRTFKYLGVITGVQVDENASITEALRRLNSRILQWENFYLPWSAQLVLINHVLGQIPSYIMLAIGCAQKEANRLEHA
ncbi:hypothetical protein R1sor_012555 [Riccia sorocarpa]|uniref:Endonuclease/exonuclease/phosphatase domain-containing protein n=1 Tax=Riccia sorocarpa TaxID=122646 RepID=A0ABD3IAB1_9MARC